KESYRAYYERALCYEFLKNYEAVIYNYSKALKYYRMVDLYEDTYKRSTFLYARADAKRELGKNISAKRDERKAKRLSKRE
ncbi:MAG: hypothetical protein ACXVED_14620, partial [Bacteroidia bacterium]